MAEPGNIIASSNTTWATWADSTSTSTSTSASTSNHIVWRDWASATTTTDSSITYRQDYPSSPPSPETEEQIQARLERDRQRKEELEAAKLAREAAKQKAEELLRESLDKEQREQFDKTEWFFVISQSGKRYRVRHGWTGNIDEINQEDMIVAEYCIHPQIRVPVEDSMLTQKLMLEMDEERFVKIAVKTPFNTPRALAV